MNPLLLTEPKAKMERSDIHCITCGIFLIQCSDVRNTLLATRAKGVFLSGSVPDAPDSHADFGKPSSKEKRGCAVCFSSQSYSNAHAPEPNQPTSRACPGRKCDRCPDRADVAKHRLLIKTKHGSCFTTALVQRIWRVLLCWTASAYSGAFPYKGVIRIYRRNFSNSWESAKIMEELENIFWRCKSAT